jgi:hypothetical protein
VSSPAEACRRFHALKALAQEGRDRALNSPEDPKNAPLGLGDPVNLDELAAFFDQLLTRVNELGVLDVVSSFEDTFRSQISAVAPLIRASKLSSAVSKFLKRKPKDQTLGPMRDIVLKRIIDKTTLAKLSDIIDERNRIAHGRISSQPLKVGVEDTAQLLEEVLLQLTNLSR